jgi:trigger factor
LNVTSCEKKDSKTAEITVHITPEEFDSALNEAYRKNKGSISVPGFRKGKAPRKIIERMYGASVFYNDALDNILPTVCSTGIAESKMRTVGYPKIQDVQFEDDKSATVKFTVELYPEITLGTYKGLGAVKPAAVVEESAVDSEIEAVRLRNARIQTATRPAINGDTTVIDFEGFIDGVPFEGGKGEDYELVLGSNSFIPGFEAKIQGMTTGEERDLDLVFPEDYKEDLAGKPVIFKVKLKEVKEKILPELDDEFAKDVSEHDTLEEYRKSIREKLVADKQAEAEKAFEDAVLSKLADAVEADIPDAMIDEFTDNQLENMRRQLSAYGMDLPMYLNMMGTNEQGFRATMRPNAEKQVRITLGLEKVAELEGLKPSDEEIEKYYENLATRYGVEIQVAKDNIPNDSAVHDLNLQSASKLVVESAVAEDAPAEDAPANGAEKPKKTKKAKTEDTAVPADAVPAADAEDDKKAAPKKSTKKTKTEDQ